MAGWWPIVLIGLLGLGSAPVSAQQGFEVLIDTNSSLIGCDVATPDGVFEGAERIVTVTTSADGSRIASLSIRSCNLFNGTFGTPQALPGPPLPIGQGLGTDGSSVLEFVVAAARLGNPVAIRLGLVSLDGGSPQDTLLTRDGQPGGDALAVILIPPPPAPPTPIPTLTPWSLALLIGLLGAAAWLGRRRLRRHPLLLSLLISGLLIGVVWAIDPDGDPSDWSGIDPLGTDPAGDSIPDIRAFFGTRSNGDLALRIDAVLNQPPQAQNDAFTTDEDSALNGDVLADNGNGADSDPDSDPLTVTEVDGEAADVGTDITLNSGALLTLNSNGSFAYAPNGAFDELQVDDAPGEDGFTYTISDGRGGTDSATVTITITPVDDPPEAVADTATVSEDAAATTIDVLANDTDVDDGPISIDSVTQPTNGTVVNNGSELSYQPDADYCNDGSPTDDFSYTLAPGGSSASVAVTVSCVDDPPVAMADTATVTEDDPATTIDVLANDTDVDDGPISIDSVTQPTNGTVVNNGSDLSYQPDADYCNDGTPTDDFTYTLTPGGSSASVAVTVTCVNDPPQARDDTFTTDEDSALNGDVLADNGNGADSDPDGDPLTVTEVDGEAADVGNQITLTSGALLTVNADGSFAYDPNDQFEAIVVDTPDSFTYQICDPALLCATATVTITVTPVNDAPVLAFPTAGTVNYDPFTDEPVILDPAATVTDVDSVDFDDGVLTADITTNCNDADVLSVRNQGTNTDEIGVSGNEVSYEGTVIGDLATDADCDDTDALPKLAIDLNVDATLEAVQALLQNLIFSTTDTGTDPRTVEVTVSDGDGGTSNTVSREVTLDEAPRLTSKSPDNDTGVALDSTITLNFSESVAFSGTDTSIDCGGTVLFTVGGSPGIVITLDPTGDLPSGTSCTVTVAAADVTDTDAIDPPDHPVEDEIFSFTTVDQPPVVDTVVPADNADPVAGDTDIELTFSEEVVVTGNWAEVDCTSSGTRDVNSGLSVTDNNPTFILDPDTDFAAGETCTVTVFAAQVNDTDGIPPAGMDGGDFTSTFTIDAAPEITATSPNDGATNVEPNAVVTIDFSEAVSVAGGAVGVSCDGSAQSFTLGTPDTDTVTLTPTPSWTPGTACTVTLTAASITDTDAVDPPDQLIGTTSFGFGVKPVADADGPFAVTGNIQIAIAAPGVYDGDQRGSTTPATVASFDASSSEGGNVSVSADGSFTYDPPAGFTGDDSFTYTLSNANGTSDPATVSLTVSDRVWFVDNSQGCPGDGRFTAPFCTIANFNGATTSSGDHIALRAGTYSETDGIDLGNSQVLIGNAVQFDTVFSASSNSIQAYKTFAAGTAATPTIAASAGNGIDLAANNTVRGVQVGNTSGTGIAGSSVGDLSLTDTAITGQGKALDINGGGTVTINLSQVQVTSSTAGGVSLQNIGGTSTFGAVNLITTGGTGFLASNAGTLTVTGSSNTIDSGTATALNIANTDIGAGRITFQSISSNGGSTPGIVLDTTGAAGGLTVTGNGGDCKNNAAQCSGGSITNKTGDTDGILLTDTANIDLSHMNVSGHSCNGIFGTRVNGFRLNQSRFTDNADQVNPDEAAVHFVDSTGSALGGTNPTRFDDLLVSNSHEHNVIIRNDSGTITNLAVDNSLFTNDGGSTQAGNNFLIDAGGTANVTVNVTGSQFDGSTTPGMLTAFGLVGDAADTSSVTVNTSSSSFSDNNVALSASVSNAGNVTFDFSDHPTVTGSRSNAINVFANANHTGMISGWTENNVVGTNGMLSSGSQFGSGVRVSNEGTGTVTALIDNNTIQEVGDGNVNAFEGIFINENVNGGTTNVTITDNTLDRIRDDRGINVQQVNGGGTLCSDISGNTLTNIGSTTPLRVRQVSGTHNVRQLDPAGAANPNRLDTANGGVAVSVAGTITFNAGACPQP